MTARERHSLAEAAIESVIVETPRPYRFIYLDVRSPDWLREILACRASEWGLEVVRIDEPIWPQEARRSVVDVIGTEYVVFMDNDVQVEAGWVDSLVACADATGAGIVGPLFINHLVGTASVLVRYGFRAETVAAGLLHSAYIHCPAHQGGIKAGVDAEIIAIAAANELDMHLSGEFRYSGRTDSIKPHVLGQIARVSQVLGVDGLHESLRLAQERQTTVGREFLSSVRYSYRIGRDKRSAVPMATNAHGTLT